MNKKKILKQSIKETFNHETGELTKSEDITDFVVPSEPDFVKIYLEDIKNLHGLSATVHAVLNELLRITDYNNEIIFNSTVKKRIYSSLDMPRGTFDNCITALKKSNIIKSVGYATYMINPEYFGRGPWKQVYQNRAKYQKIKVTTVYTAKGKKKVETEIVDDTDAMQEAADAADMTMEEFIDNLDGDIDFV
ncbi:MAG: replication/maintenance protein RepL [Alphaproteobacteria bacterium]|nr:replication/maintenance protein RepL [Alphaproteobacteria bacterium]